MRFLAPFLPYILAAGAFFAALIGYGAKQRSRGRTDAETDVMQDAFKREGDGRNAVAKEQSDAEGLSNSAVVDRVRSRRKP